MKWPSSCPLNFGEFSFFKNLCSSFRTWDRAVWSSVNICWISYSSKTKAAVTRPMMMMVMMMVMVIMMLMVVMMVMIIIIITNLNTNTNCLIRFGDTKAPSSSFASWRSPWATKQIAKNPTNVDRTSNCYISGFKRAREVLKKGNSSKFNGQDDGHFILGPALKV